MRIAIFAAACLIATVAMAQPEPAPFAPDDHTLLLYHLDDAKGETVADASGHGMNAVLQGAQWDKGKWGGGLAFNGESDSAFLAQPDAIRGVKQITVECWFKPNYMGSRRFLIGHDVCFHFEVDDGGALSISLYNEGGSVPNAEGKPHQQVSLGGVSVRSGRWHHMAITYDGSTVGYFLDGAFRGRQPGPKDFSLGVQSRGLWLGCYVGMDYWYSGLMDEVRVSDTVRYDPEGTMKPGDRIFPAAQVTKAVRPAPAVRAATKQGQAQLNLTLQKLHGGEASAWVCLKPPGKPSVIVGEWTCAAASGEMAEASFDVSDEYAGNGPYMVGLVPRSGGYFALTGARMDAGEAVVGRWTGEKRLRWTFQQPIVVALQPAGAAPVAKPKRVVLAPAAADWATGGLELDTEEEDQPPLMTGDGSVEWWLDVPASTYRVYMRYACGAPRPCDIVIDGKDLNDYDMCAVNTTGQSTAGSALWEYQGSVTLAAGQHWLRVQDVLPDIVALRLEPVAATAAAVPLEHYPVPVADALAKTGPWKAQAEFGQGAGTVAAGKGLELSAAFANTNKDDLFAGDRVRFACPVKWDLEPYGRLDFTFQGTGSGHVAETWLVDAKGDEKLIWRQRDNRAEPVEVQAPLSFEGNDVFDPGHVVAVCVDLDEGNTRAAQANQMKVRLQGLTLNRRDILALPDGYQGRLQQALTAVRGYVSKLAAIPQPLSSPAFRPWTKPVVPEEHPLHAGTEPKPVTRATMGYDLHSTGSRSIDPRSIRDHHESHNFGDVCWPHIGILPQRRDYKTDEDYQKALQETETRLQDVKAHGLYLFDIWGYVPNGEAGPVPRVSPEHHEMLMRIFGDRFLGYDNGEQDGRYIGSYADRDAHTDRRGGWDSFVRWDQGICNDSMNYMNATGSLNFSHYYGERGARMLGLETAQGLPSDTLMFAFLRGAGKQYGRLTYQATSIWNRYGYNMYHARKIEGGNGYGLGPNKGCSLSLHKRLFFQSYSGGDSIVGSETSQFTADRLEGDVPELSPLGKQHLEVMDFAKKHPERGIMYTPVAFMMDFYNGWNMPRHLYRGDQYKIWGRLPYEKGDYLTDQVFRMVWPGYEDTSYLRNERGFVCDTPYGDIFDVVTNRCHEDILKQYTTIMLLGEVELTPEVIAELEQFVRQGGDVLMDANHARQLPASLTGLELGEKASACTTAQVAKQQVWSEQPYTYYVARPTTAATYLFNEAQHPVLTVNKVGQGRVVVCLADNWMTDQLNYADPKLVSMEPPYTLLNGVRAVLGGYFSTFSPVSVTPGSLNVRVNCYANDPKRLLVSLTNNNLFADWQGKLQLRGRQVQVIRDLRGEAAVSPAGLTVPAGDVTVLEVRLK